MSSAGSTCETAIDAEHLRSWVGRREESRDIVTADLAARFHATLDLPSAPPTRGEIAPRLVHHCLSPHLAGTSALTGDGHPRRGDFLPPVPFPRRMWAGSSTRFLCDIRVGDVVCRASRIADVALKRGSTGALCFVAVDHVLTVEGREAIVERQDIVYRADAPPTVSQPSAPIGRRVARCEPTPQLLFRYSAVMFNAHRIHYDRPYATNVEGYPGLVVHGPLQAALLLNFAAQARGGAAPDEYVFRSRTPLFDTCSFTLNANDNADGVELWTAAEGGPIATYAYARWR